jgi:protein-disulfide isomerase-like protein with CxxC motif
MLLVSDRIYPNELDKELINKINNHMSKIARETNQQMGGSRIDETTTFRHVVYDPTSKALVYTYSATVDFDKLNSDQSGAMYVYHRNKSCNGAFAPVIKSYGMKIEHVFENARTGRVLWRKSFSSKECFEK